MWFGGGAVALCVLNGYGKWEKFHRKVRDVNGQVKRKVYNQKHAVLYHTTPRASGCILVSPPSVCSSEIK